MGDGGPPIRVLLVDDSAMMRRVLRARLSAEDDVVVVVDEAADGAEGVRKAEEHAPDVVLLDLEMPRVGGREALPHLRARTAARVVVVSSLVQPGAPIRTEMRRAGADAVLAKPSGALSLDLGSSVAGALVAAIRRSAARARAAG
ncbi:MAG: response regulator [Rhodospirillales bacterium]|jgi:two-component system chemotaxis response regulator CheB